MALKTCKECGKEVSTKAEKCPNCGVEIYKPTSFGTWIGAIFLAYMLYAIGTCTSKFAAPTPSNISNAEPAAVVQTVVEEQTPNSWDYSNSVDDISAKQQRTAGIISNNKIDLKFPHEAGTTALILIRNHPRYGKEIIFRVTSGQLNCQYDNCYINLRFDDGPIIKNYVTEPADHSNNVYFLSNFKKTFNQIKKSKKMYVEVTFYRQGSFTFEFNTENLQPDLLEFE